MMMQGGQRENPIDSAGIKQMPLQGFSHRFTERAFPCAAWAIDCDYRDGCRHLFLLQ